MDSSGRPAPPSSSKRVQGVPPASPVELASSAIITSTFPHKRHLARSNAVATRNKPKRLPFSWCVVRACWSPQSRTARHSRLPNDGGSRGHNSRWKQLREGPRMLRCYPRGCFSMSCLDRSADQILYRLCRRNEYVAGCLLIQNMLCPGGRVCVSPFSPSQVGPRNDRPRSQSTKSHDVQGRINACS